MWMGQERLVYLYIYIYSYIYIYTSRVQPLLRHDCPPGLYLLFARPPLPLYVAGSYGDDGKADKSRGPQWRFWVCIYIYNSTSGNTVYLYALTASCALLRLMISEEEFLARSLTSWPLGCLTWTSFRLQKVTHRPRPGHFKFSHRPRPGRWPRPRRFIHRPRRFSHRPRPRQFSLQPARPCQWMRF